MVTTYILKVSNCVPPLPQADLGIVLPERQSVHRPAPVCMLRKMSLSKVLRVFNVRLTIKAHLDAVSSDTAVCATGGREGNYAANPHIYK